MMYQCEKCGRIFEEEEIVVDSWREYRGECHGVPAWETVTEEHCPYCHNDRISEYEEGEDEQI